MKRHVVVYAGILWIALSAGMSRAQTVTAADYDGNGVVDFPDFLMFAQAYGTDRSAYNLDGQGTVDFADFLMFARLYGQRVILPDIQIDPETLLDSLRPEHPRLILTDPDLEDLKALGATDPRVQKLLAEVLYEANRNLNKSPLAYELLFLNPQLLLVSRECMARIYALGMAWRWTGQEKYAQKAVENLLTVSAFPDWNPSHFLDTAEMSHAVGIGYDWLYPYMDVQTRETVRASLIKNGLIPGTLAYEDTPAWWTSNTYNWNLVCNNGLIVGALAVADTDPEYARAILPNALRSLPNALKSYRLDGAWGEGAGYWRYATRYASYGISALESALGTDFGLKDFEGLSVTARFPIYATGPTGYIFNYADCQEKIRQLPVPCNFWLAKVFDDDLVAYSEHRLLSEHPSEATPEHLIWYVPRPGTPEPAPLDKLFRGVVGVAVFRSAWNDPNALFVGIKAGYNQVNHGHLDLGSFEMDALGVRWARDLGGDDYDLPDYWRNQRGGGRWQYFRMGSLGHNVPLLGGENQNPEGVASIIRFETEGAFPFAQVDLSTAYSDYAGSVTRGIALVNGRKAVLVQDEFELQTSCEVAWGMTTDADISPDAGEEAQLSLDGKKLRAVVLSPQGARFSAESAEQQPPQKINKGVSRLMVRMPDQQGRVRLAVWLVPVWGDGEQLAAPEIKPLAEW